LGELVERETEHSPYVMASRVTWGEDAAPTSGDPMKTFNPFRAVLRVARRAVDLAVGIVEVGSMLPEHSPLPSDDSELSPKKQA